MFGVRSREQENKNSEFLKLLEGRLQVLYRIAYSYYKDKDKASDAVQDSILIAYKNITMLKDKGKFNSWITTILVNCCRESLRRDNKIHFEEYEEKVIDIGRLYEKNGTNSFSNIDDKLYILNILQSLDEKYSEVIRLKYLGDYTLAEISTILDIPVGTVKSRLNVGIKQLKSLMEVDKSVL